MASTSSVSWFSPAAFGAKLRNALLSRVSAAWSAKSASGVIAAQARSRKATVDELYRAARQALRSASANVGKSSSATGRMARLAPRFDLERNILDALLMRCVPLVGELIRRVESRIWSRTAH